MRLVEVHARCTCRSHVFSYLIIYMKKFRNSDWLRAVRLIPISAILCYHSAHLCYQYKFQLSQCKFVLTHFGGKKPSREKQIWRPRLGKLREHFLKIWSEFYFDTASKMSVNYKLNSWFEVFEKLTRACFIQISFEITNMTCRRLVRRTLMIFPCF